MSSEQDEVVQFRREGHIGVITLNRPDAMNAVNGAMSVALGEIAAEFIADDGLWVGVLTGAGRAFCAGADLKEVAAGKFLTGDQWDSGIGGIIKNRVPKPLIAAVNGYAFGGGTELMLACDLAVMSDTAALGLPEVKRGIIAAGGGMMRLAKRMPLAIALEYVMTGDRISPEAALQWGLVNRVVPQDDVLPAAMELAESIVANAPLAVEASKGVVYDSLTRDDWDEHAWALSDGVTRGILRTADAKEGPRAFVQKRAPEWSRT
ncbi:enoyl-CoA hydratase-related protein [Mycobacteroides immunogenum]|uniref:Probable enoyl-CoA hydratase EchA17 n=1 Tax=Mycobacteroides immunogenum TaxID=83262 RepID=A0A7V8RU56_9MYCO|nr:enoyl-CoA hydratase-related protein [Mycobacteroides immunogenum]AMT72308.1 enoyl-CoA hydratase [Mycobacteroides immunogenum]ANO05449.1 enoyl-CoA hydratase [Mycobacteroides immunogenum]KPG02987.1 enoyl-CoA hydratase [Mycobacteroides immunogenum]KPG03063.1 enoyl-CoA hydratase [Mycobacteroides immunogenum]KPG10937.1 enoyl-CoA hydratase [Mycobacteroides immunogenum]